MIKLGQGSTGGEKAGHDNYAGVVAHAARVPRAATRATRKVERGLLARGKRARGKEGKWKSGTIGKVERERRKKGKEEG